MKRSSFAVFALIAAMALSSCSQPPQDTEEVTSASSVSEVSESSSAEEEDDPAPAQDEETAKPPEEEAPALNGVTVTFGSESGFYKTDLTLEMTCSDDNAVIYFTNDGSIPTQNSIRYSKPITLLNKTSSDNFLSIITGLNPGSDYTPKDNIVKANVIRAAAFLPDGSRGEVTSGTFFVGVNRKTLYGDAPVISLITETKNLFGYENGIFVMGKTYDDWLAEDPKNAGLESWQAKGNYSNKGREWERPVTVEYFSADGSLLFAQDMGMRVMGAASRGETQKSLRITAREEYGKKSVKKQLIPGNMRSDGSGEVEKYKSFILRNGGNDCNFAKLRDPYLQSLVSDRRFDTQQYVPAVVFIDGEYWGMYALCEDYSDNYIENNYGIDKSNVIVVKKGEIEDGEEDDIALFDEMYDLITDNDMSDADNYARASEMLDMGSFADLCAFNFYIYNEDSPFDNNNWEMWRVRTPDGLTDCSDGKWRTLVYDTEFSTGIYQEGKNYNQNNISKVLNQKKKAGDRSPADIFRSLYQNEDFRREFVNALCDIRNINFGKTSALSALKLMSGDYIKLAPDTFRRFGPDWVAWQDTRGYITQRINELSLFIGGRYDSFPDIMEKAMDNIGSQAEMTLSVSGKGEVFLNSSRRGVSGDMSGVYFTGCDIALRAEPADGGSFSRWEYSGCAVSDASSAEITVSFDGPFTLTAVFE